MRVTPSSGPPGPRAPGEATCRRLVAGCARDRHPTAHRAAARPGLRARVRARRAGAGLRPSTSCRVTARPRGGPARRRHLRGRRAGPARQPSLFGGAKASSSPTSTRPPTSCRPTCSPSSPRPEPDLTLVVTHKSGAAGQEGARHPQEGAGPASSRRPAIKTDRDKSDFADARVPPGPAQGHPRGRPRPHRGGRQGRPRARGGLPAARSPTRPASSTSSSWRSYHGGKVEATGFRVADAAMAGDTRARPCACCGTPSPSGSTRCPSSPCSPSSCAS